MRRYFLLSVLCGCLLQTSVALFSMPANPEFFTITNADGQPITLRMRGDENMKWMESEDGYSLLYDDSHRIVYAVLNEHNDMIPSDIPAANAAFRSAEINERLQQIPRGLRYSAAQQQICMQANEWREQMFSDNAHTLRSAIGSAKAICALIEFPDKSFTHTRDEFDRLMNETGYNLNSAKGSVKDFFYENSYGQLDLDITVAGIYKVSKNSSYYGQNDANKNDLYPREMAMEVANLVFNDPNINPADYDNDGDGYIDAFHIIFAGYGEESGGGDTCIWSHEWGFSTLTFGTIKINKYSCSPELRGNKNSNSGKLMSHIGVTCHELTHIFGAPDYYDVDYEPNDTAYPGTGEWDLMADGSWNASGARPAHINMFQKIKFGWVTPIELKDPTQVIDMPNSAQNPVAYIIKTSKSTEYFVLENRQKVGFDTSVPGHGLLIYHASATNSQMSNNTVNKTHPQGLYPVYAASTLEYPTGSISSYGSINSANCTFSTNASRNTFSDTSTPAMRTWSGAYLNKPITEITESSGLISFKFNYAPSINLELGIVDNRVALRWNRISGAEGYKIYRDGEFIQLTTDTIFRESLTQSGTYIYGVAVLYPTYESAPEEVTAKLNFVGIEQPTPVQPKISPNPLKRGEYLAIELGYGVGVTEIEVYDLSGRRLLTQQTATSSARIATSTLPSGMYLLRLKNDLQTCTFKLRIEN